MKASRSPANHERGYLHGNSSGYECKAAHRGKYERANRHRKAHAERRAYSEQPQFLLLSG